MNKEQTRYKIRQTLRKDKVKRGNTIFISVFLAIAAITVILKLVEVILLDLGYFEGEFHLNFWTDKKWLSRAYDPVNPNIVMQKMVERHPNVFWPFTQFTWMTTFIIIIFMVIRLFKYDQKKTPKWIRWSMRQRTISLLAMYDFIVCFVFWGGIFKYGINDWNPDIVGLQLVTTIFVHAIIPILTITYSFIYLAISTKASILKEKFIIKGMIWPSIYSIYYILISVVWGDPYSITNLHNDFVGNIYLLPIALLVIYIMLGIMIIVNNWFLLKYNKNYDPENDYQARIEREQRKEKIIKKVIKRYKKNQRTSKGNINGRK